jgi:hypothetical protein
VLQIQIQTPNDDVVAPAQLDNLEQFARLYPDAWREDRPTLERIIAI